MKVKLLYYGMISELFGKNEEEIEQSFRNIKELKSMLIDIKPKLKELSFIFAVNNEIVEEFEGIKNGDIIALLPPFAGG